MLRIRDASIVALKDEVRQLKHRQTSITAKLKTSQTRSATASTAASDAIIRAQEVANDRTKPLRDHGGDVVNTCDAKYSFCPRHALVLTLPNSSPNAIAACEQIAKRHAERTTPAEWRQDQVITALKVRAIDVKIDKAAQDILRLGSAIDKIVAQQLEAEQLSQEERRLNHLERVAISNETSVTAIQGVQEGRPTTASWRKLLKRVSKLDAWDKELAKELFDLSLQLNQLAAAIRR